MTHTNCIPFTYDPDGNVLTQTDSTGATTNTYDHLDRLPSTVKSGTTTKTYTYDNAGNLATYTDQAATVSYSYDAANNVLSEADTSAGSTTARPGAAASPPSTAPSTTITPTALARSGSYQ